LNWDHALMSEPSGSMAIADILEFANAQLLELRLAAGVMKTIVELMGITEKIDTALKVTQDVYYAKIYLAALRLFRVKEWEACISKKLDIASNTDDMICQGIANKRAEIQERVFVIVIILEIVIFFKGPLVAASSPT